MKKLYFLAFALCVITMVQANSFLKCSCSVIHLIEVTVVPTFDPIGPICEGATPPVLPTTSLNGITGTWLPSVISNTTSGTYVFTPDAGQDAMTTTLAILVIEQPNPGILTGNQTICIGSTSEFTSTVTGGTWDSSDPVVATVNAITGVVTGVSVGTTTIVYTVAGTAPCTNATATKTITVSAPPEQPSIQGYLGICAGSYTTLMAYPDGGTWSSSNNAVAMVDSTGFVLGISSGTATITYTIYGSGGCGNKSDSKIVRVTTTPTIILISDPSTANQTVCLNTPIAPIIYSIGTLDADGGAVTGLPTGVSGSYNSGVFTITGVPSQVGTFSYTVYPQGYCGFTSLTGTIVVSPNASLTLTSSIATTNQIVCVNTSIVPITYTIGNGVTSVFMSAGSLPSGVIGQFNVATGILTIFGTPDSTGAYNFMITTNGGCGSASLSGTITVSPSFTTSLFCDQSQVTSPNSVFFDWSAVVGSTGYQYSYSINNGPIITGSTLVSHYEVFGVLPGQSVLFTLTNVPGVTCFQPIATTCSLLANSDFKAEFFSYFPNPVHDILNLTYKLPITRIEIFNLVGQQVFNTANNSKMVQVNMTEFNKGIYMVKVTSDTTSQTIKVIKD